VKNPTTTPQEPHISVAQLEAEQKASIQRSIDKALAIQRVNDYVRDAGLVESDANGALIRKFMEDAGGIWTPALVDACIIALNNQLEWRSTEPAEPEKAEILQPWQLKIDTPDWALKKVADVRALKDLIARRRKLGSKYHRPSGSFGSSLF